MVEAASIGNQLLTDMENNRTIDDEVLNLSWIEQVLYLAKKGAEERMVRALIRTMPESEWQQLEEEGTPSVVCIALQTLYWEKSNVSYEYEVQEQPKYRPVSEVLEEFLGTGKRQVARKELQIRLPYVTALEQKQIIYAFLDSDAKLDREYVCKYLDSHYELMYEKAIETIWGLHHDAESAKVLIHYASDKFVAENFDQLASDYRYLPVRLRMPKDYPVDRSQMEQHEFLHLCARQQLPITEHEAFAVLSNTLLLQLIRHPHFSSSESLYKLPYVSTIINDIGRLGFRNIIVRFFVENERTKPLFTNGDPYQVSTTIRDQIYHDGFYYYRDVLNTKEDISRRELAKR